MSEWAIFGAVIGGIILALEVVYPLSWLSVKYWQEKRRKKHGKNQRG